MNSFPKRKNARLDCYDYSRNGAYFITICVKDRRCILSRIDAETCAVQLSEIGAVVDYSINQISRIYPNAEVLRYIIMPNHIHFILILTESGGRAVRAPTVSGIINQLKGYVTKQIGVSIWQKLFYDHIIRDETDCFGICRYIEGNPVSVGKRRILLHAVGARIARPRYESSVSSRQ